MAVGQTAKELLSAILKRKDRSALNRVKESQFGSKEEVDAYRNLLRYVTRHNAFPSRVIFQRRIGFEPVTVTEPVSFYLDEFEKRAKWNAARKNFRDLSDAMATRDVDTIERLLETMNLSVRSMRYDTADGIRMFDDIMDEVIHDFNQARFSGQITGIPCGWEAIDQQTWGYQPGDLISWVARLGRGKTMLLLKQALAASVANKRTLFVSPEMPDKQLVRRMIGMITGVNPRLISRGQLSNEVHARMIARLDEIRGTLPLQFMAGAVEKSMPRVRQACRDFDAEYCCGDAAYLIQPGKKRSGSGSRREVISDMADEAKDIATSLNIPFNISVQFNRTAVRPERSNSDEGEQRSSNRDPLAHLDVHKIGETDVIAQNSSLVFVAELGDAPNQHSSRYVGIKKGRDGDQGWWKINYHFNPFNMDIIEDGNRGAGQTTQEIAEEDLDEDIE